MANTVCFLFSTGIFYLLVFKGWLDYLPRKFRGNKTRINTVEANSSTKYDWELIKSYRKLQVMNKITSVIYAKAIAASHHEILMLISLVSIFLLIRLREEFNAITYTAVYVAAAISIMVPFVEFKAIAMISVSANAFLRGFKKRNMRETLIGKTVHSLPVIRMEVGKPFYTVKPHTTIFAMDFLMQFLSMHSCPSQLK